MDHKTSLTIVKWYNVVFATALLWWTDKLAAGYGVTVSDNSMMFMKIMGAQFFASAMGNSLVLRVGDKTTSSYTCLANAIGYAAFTVDGAVNGLKWAEAIKMDINGMYFNIACSAALAYISYLGWVDTGSKKPEIVSFSDMGKKLTVVRVSNGIGLLFGLMFLFKPQMLKDTYMKGFAFTAEDEAFITQIWKNIGLFMLCNTLRSEFTIASGNNNILTGCVRATAFWWCLNCGMQVVNEFTCAHLGWPLDQQIRLTNFVMNFGMFFWSANVLVEDLDSKKRD